MNEFKTLLDIYTPAGTKYWQHQIFTIKLNLNLLDHKSNEIIYKIKK